MLLAGAELTVAAAAIGIAEAESARFDAGVITNAVVAGEAVTARFQARARVSSRVAATRPAGCAECRLRLQRHYDGHEKRQLDPA